MSTESQSKSLPERPKVRDGIEMIPVHNDLVLYDGANETGVSLNQSAKQIWDLADGSRTVAEIAGEIAEALSITDEAVVNELETDIRTTLLDFQRNRLLK